MVNNASGYADWADAVGSERLVLGFAGAGGTRVGNVVRYVVVSRLLQPTTFGELEGSASPRLKEIMHVISRCRIPYCVYIQHGCLAENPCRMDQSARERPLHG